MGTATEMTAITPDLHAASARDLDALIACPQCDALYRITTLDPGARARCARCHTVLISPRKKAGMRIIMFALAVMILTAGALWFPFLTVERAGFSNSATLVDSALAFSDGPLVVLVLLVLAFIVLVPLARVTLIVYTLAPLVFDRPPAVHAAAAFRLSEALKPWSMAEIFALGCAVSLVKIADLATVGVGPAFYMFVAVVVLVVLQDIYLDRWSVWNALDPRPRQDPAE